MSLNLQVLKQELSCLHWTEKFETSCLAAMLATIPINTGISLVFTCCWFLCVVLKNSLLKRWSFFAWHQDKSHRYNRCAYMLIPLMVYWLAYLVSLLWIVNLSKVWVEVGQLVWFFVIPLTCLCTDFRQISKHCIRAMFWFYVFSLILVFVFLIVKALLLTFQSASHSFMNSIKIFDQYKHHAYTSLFIITGLAFLYIELIRSQSRKMRILICCCVCSLLLYLLFANSRAGILGLILLSFMCGLHTCIVRNQYKLGLASIVAVIALVAVVHFTLPDQYRRLSKTTSELSQGETTDVRFRIMNNAWMVVKDNALLGVGASDRLVSLVPYYGSLEHTTCAHNQFLDTWLAIGVFGMLTLWVILLQPMVIAWKRHQIFPIMINTILIVNLLVESMLERQMGVVFVAVIYIYYVMLLSPNGKQLSGKP